MGVKRIKKDLMFYRFAMYGFLKNLKFFEPFLILFFRDAGLLYVQIGLLYSIRDVATNILEVPAGVLADSFGRRRAMVMAFAGYIVSFLVFFFFDRFYIFALAMLFFAAGEALRTGTHKALILEYLSLNDMEDLKVSYYGRTRAASQLGSALNALIAAGLAFYTGNYRYMFLAAIIPYVLDLINLWTYPRELDGELASPGVRSMIQQARATLQSFRAMFTEGDALRTIGNSASFSAFFKASKDYLQPILETLALSLPVLLSLADAQRSAIVVGVVYSLIYLLASYASRNSDRFTARFASLVGAANATYLLGAVCLILSGLASLQRVVALAVVVYLGWYLLYNIRRPQTVALVSDRVEQRVMASGLSVESQLTTIVSASLAPILGALADWLGVGAGLLVLGVGMLGLVPLLRLKERRGTTPAIDRQ